MAATFPGRFRLRAATMKTGQCIDIPGGLESWYASERGRYLLEQIRLTLQPVLEITFGYHLLQIGTGRGQPLFDASPINHRVYCAAQGGDGIGLVCEPDELPLESDSVDAIIAHHCLEFAPNPHQVLREIQRVLTPQGHLLIVGFNPHSLLGIGNRLRGLNRQSLWHRCRPLSESRLTDWLHLLGCEVQGRTRLFSMPPSSGGRIRRWLPAGGGDRWHGPSLPIGGLYLLHAIKQVSALNRPRRQRRLRSERLIALVPNPAAAPSPTPRTPAGVRAGWAELGSQRGEHAA